MVERTLVSVGLPVRNGAPAVDRALQLLRGQTWPDLEIVISDNASSDATAAICARHASEDPRVRYERTEHDIGMLPNFGRVLSLASGPLFMWAAHDDRWAPDHVARLVALLAKDPGAVVAAGRTVDVAADGSLVADHVEVGELAIADRYQRIRSCVAQDERLGKCNLLYGLFRRQALVTIDPVAFWAADDRRLDHHLVLAALCRGNLAFDRNLVFEKQLRAPAARSTAAAAGAWLRGTREALRWVAAYPGVVREQAPQLSAAEVRAITAASRRRLARVLADRLVRLASAGRV